MAQTTITVVEENGKCQIRLEEGAQNGTRNDQKIACQLVGMAQKMFAPGVAQKIQQLQGNPMLAKLMHGMGF